MTMFEIEKIVLGKNMQKFRMRCSMKDYEQGMQEAPNFVWRQERSLLFIRTEWQIGADIAVWIHGELKRWSIYKATIKMDE